MSVTFFGRGRNCKGGKTNLKTNRISHMHTTFGDMKITFSRFQKFNATKFNFYGWNKRQ